MKPYWRSFFVILAFAAGIFVSAQPVHARPNCLDMVPPVEDCPDGQRYVQDTTTCGWTCRSVGCFMDSQCADGEMCVSGSCQAPLVCKPASLTPANGTSVTAYPPVIGWSNCDTVTGYYQVSITSGGINWTSPVITTNTYALDGLYFKKGTSYTWNVRKCTTGSCTVTSAWASGTFVYNSNELVLGPGQETFISMYNNAVIGTMDNGAGKIKVVYKTIGSGNGSLVRESYSVYQRKLWTTTTFSLPASSSYATVTLGSNPNSYWNGTGSTTLKVKNASTTNILVINYLNVYGKDDNSVMGTWPQAPCGGGAACQENYICYNNTCRYGCGTTMDCPTGSTCDVYACIPSTTGPFCNDTDGANYYNKGTVTTNASGWTSPVSDVCATQANPGNFPHTTACSGANCYVVEYKCTGATPGTTIQACQNGCSDGACSASCNGVACPAGQACYQNACRQICSSTGTCTGAYHCDTASNVCIPGSSSSSSSSVGQQPTATPYPTAAPDKAQLYFKLNMPDVATSVGVVPDVRVEVRDGAGSNVTTATVVLVRKQGTDFFINSTPLVLDVPAGNYTLYIKQLKTIRHKFDAVRLAKGETTDCSKDNPGTECGSLKDSGKAPFYSGDSDGFNDGAGGTTRSSSFNRIDNADLEKLRAGYGSSSLPAEPNADFNLDRKIDIFDLAILGKNYGKPAE